MKTRHVQLETIYEFEKNGDKSTPVSQELQQIEQQSCNNEIIVKQEQQTKKSNQENELLLYETLFKEKSEIDRQIELWN